MLDTLGKYRLERELGRGGMGVVYLATDLSLTREVALKVVHPTLLSDSQFAVRFEREARAVAVLSHPNIVHVNAFVHEDGVLGIDMPYLSGGSLREQLVPGAPPARLVAYLMQVLRALEYCHDMGTIHRDVKPSNILLDERGQAKLSDFGLAKLLSAAFRDSMVSGSTGCFIGTPCYAPPESWDLAEPDARWDLYAVGVIAWEGLTGRLPYSASSPWQLISQLKDLPPPRLRDLALVASPPLIETVEWMMQRDPALRARSAREVIGALKNVPEYVEEPNTIPPTRVRSSKRPVRLGTWRGRLVSAFGARPVRAVAAGSVGVALGLGAATAYVNQVGRTSLPVLSPREAAPVPQKDLAADTLPDLTALQGSTRLAEGNEARVYAFAMDENSAVGMSRALLVRGAEPGKMRAFLYGAASLWVGELSAADALGAYEGAGTWLGAESAEGGVFGSGSWRGSLKLLGDEKLALFNIQAVRDQDRKAFSMAAAGEQFVDGADTSFVLGLESHEALASLIFREGLPRQILAARWVEELLPGWVEGRGALASVGEAALVVDGQLSETCWAARPGPVLARPLAAKALLMLAVARDAITIGLDVPQNKLPERWELRVRLGRADAPTGLVWVARVAHDGTGSLGTEPNGGTEVSNVTIKAVAGHAGERVQLECGLVWAEELPVALNQAIPWRCNAQLIDLDADRAVLEWGSPDISALAHGALFAPLVRKEAE